MSTELYSCSVLVEWEQEWGLYKTIGQMEYLQLVLEIKLINHFTYLFGTRKPILLYV